MPAAYTTLKIIGAVGGDISLVDGENYSLAEGGWGPGVPNKRRQLIAVGGRFDEVEESITLNIFDTTGAAALGNLEALAAALRQAQQFADGENVDPVLIEVQPQGSNLVAALKAVIMGGDGGLLALPATFNDLLMIYEIAGVIARFKRRGAWLDAGETPGASTASAVPAIESVSFASSHNIPSPVAIELSGFSSSTLVIQNGIVLVTNDADKLAIIEAETATSGGTSVGDALARGGTVRQVSSLLGSTTLFYTLTSTQKANLNRCHVWAVVRNNSTTTQWQLQTIFQGAGEAVNGLKVLVTAESQDPQTVYLGELVMNNSITDFILDVLALPAGGSETLDIDFLLLMRSDENGHVIGINYAYLGFSGTQVLNIDHRLLTGFPTVYVNNGTDTSYASYEGSPIVELTGDECAVIFHATRGVNWLHGSSISLTATRHKAYLTPQ